MLKPRLLDYCVVSIVCSVDRCLARPLLEIFISHPPFALFILHAPHGGAHITTSLSPPMSSRRLPYDSSCELDGEQFFLLFRDRARCFTSQLSLGNLSLTYSFRILIFMCRVVHRSYRLELCESVAHSNLVLSLYSHVEWVKVMLCTRVNMCLIV